MSTRTLGVQLGQNFAKRISGAVRLDDNELLARVVRGSRCLGVGKRGEAPAVGGHYVRLGSVWRCFHGHGACDEEGHRDTA